MIICLSTQLTGRQGTARYYTLCRKQVLVVANTRLSVQTGTINQQSIIVVTIVVAFVEWLIRSEKSHLK